MWDAGRRARLEHEHSPNSKVVNATRAQNPTTHPSAEPASVLLSRSLNDLPSPSLTLYPPDFSPTLPTSPSLPFSLSHLSLCRTPLSRSASLSSASLSRPQEKYTSPAPGDYVSSRHELTTMRRMTPTYKMGRASPSFSSPSRHGVSPDGSFESTTYTRDPVRALSPGKNCSGLLA